MGAHPHDPSVLSLQRSRLVVLQSITLVWMLVECGVSLFSAVRAHSSVLLAFGLDSFVELLSASLVLLAIAPRFSFSHRRINTASGSLLFVLAAVVAVASLLALAGKVQPMASPLGIFITVAALIVMPLLAWQKRKLAGRTGNNALAADAVQSATCAYLALLALAGLVLNAVFHIAWIDSAAALAAIPILIQEGRRAMRGQSCGCC
jgi:divalent metal cation (Fe/Co/Zn/Cd) transporter